MMRSGRIEEKVASALCDELLVGLKLIEDNQSKHLATLLSLLKMQNMPNSIKYAT
jgi:hypothetical protein